MGASGHDKNRQLTSLEICAGAGGQAIGLHRAGFRHLALVEYDRHAHATLVKNVSGADDWQGCEVLCEELINEFDPLRKMKALRAVDAGPGGDGRPLERGELDLLSGGVPCPPFSVAGKQLGKDDERDLFPRMLKIVDALRPRAVMIENVRGLMEVKFRSYREDIIHELQKMDYWCFGWKLPEARDYGVPQLRPRSILVAIRKDSKLDDEIKKNGFPWPQATNAEGNTVFSALESSMAERVRSLSERFPSLASRFESAHEKWREESEKNGGVAPTLVGGSRKHGGADLGPSRAKEAWRRMYVNAQGVADEPEDCTDPYRDFLRKEGPMLTVKQAAIIQSFPEAWRFSGGKTARYRQVGNAFPPNVACAIGSAISAVLDPARKEEMLKGLKVAYIPALDYVSDSGGMLFDVSSEGVDMSAPAPTPAADGERDLVGACV